MRVIPRLSRLGLVLALSLFNLSARAAGDNFAGHWLLALDYTGQEQGIGRGRNDDQELARGEREIAYGILDIERDGDSIRVYIDGGPVDLVKLDGNEIVFTFDWNDGADQTHIRHLRGRLAQGVLGGEIISNSNTNPEFVRFGPVEKAGQVIGIWQAVRELKDAKLVHVPVEVMKQWRSRTQEQSQRPPVPPRPVDLSGIWLHGTYAATGTNKAVFDPTPTGHKANENYRSLMDDPALRCVSDGLIRMDGGPYAVEIIQQQHQIVMLYEDFGEERHIYLDGRGFPEGLHLSPSAMGYSIGHWEGSTLVIETRGLKKAIWDAAGQALADNFTVIERRYLDDYGRLHSELIVHEPVNYQRPLFEHSYRIRALPDYDFDEYTCDPDAFYRSLYLEDQLEEYWERIPFRY